MPTKRHNPTYIERMANDIAQIGKLGQLKLDSNLRLFDVTVLHADCNDKMRGHPQKCAVSTAVRRQLPKATYASTKHNGMTVTINGVYLHFAGTNKSSQTIDAFDEGRLKPPTKLTFKLTDVRPVQKLSNERKEQVNEARRKRAAEGRPDKTNYRVDPLRARMAKNARAKEHAAKAIKAIAAE